MSKAKAPRSAAQANRLLPSAAILATESAQEFDQLCRGLKDELQLRGTVENLFGGDIAQLAWETRRYRRAKTSLVNSEITTALKKLLRPIIKSRLAEKKGAQQQEQEEHMERLAKFSVAPHTSPRSEVDIEVDRLANRWSVDARERKKISEMLGQHKLDEYAIESEAIRLVAPDLERLDRLLASCEWRLHRALRALAEFRGGLGRHLHARVERVIDGEVLAVNDMSKKSSVA